MLRINSACISHFTVHANYWSRLRKLYISARYIRKHVAFALFCPFFFLLFLLFYSALPLYYFILFFSFMRDRLSRISIGRQSRRRCRAWGSRIPRVPFRGAHTNCVTRASADNLWPWRDSSRIPRHPTAPTDAAIRFLSPRGEFVKDDRHVGNISSNCRRYARQSLLFVLQYSLGYTCRYELINN